MCAIIGFHSPRPTPEHRNRLADLWHESAIRGLHAAGAAWLDGTELRIAKAETVEALLQKLPPQAGTIIGHCRYSTSGDWREPANNQPVAIPMLALVFNGIIHMGSKAEMEADHGVTLTTENDGELAARWIRAGNDWQRRLTAPDVSYAGIHLTTDGATVFRNSRRPAWWAFEAGAVFVASTSDIFHRAGFTVAEQLPTDTAITLHELHARGA